MTKQINRTHIVKTFMKYKKMKIKKNKRNGNLFVSIISYKSYNKGK